MDRALWLAARASLLHAVRSAIGMGSRSLVVLFFGPAAIVGIAVVLREVELGLTAVLAAVPPERLPLTQTAVLGVAWLVAFTGRGASTLLHDGRPELPKALGLHSTRPLWFGWIWRTPFLIVHTALLVAASVVTSRSFDGATGARSAGAASIAIALLFLASGSMLGSAVISSARSLFARVTRRPIDGRGRGVLGGLFASGCWLLWSLPPEALRDLPVTRELVAHFGSLRDGHGSTGLPAVSLALAASLVLWLRGRRGLLLSRWPEPSALKARAVPWVLSSMPWRAVAQLDSRLWRRGGHAFVAGTVQVAFALALLWLLESELTTVVSEALRAQITTLLLPGLAFYWGTYALYSPGLDYRVAHQLLAAPVRLVDRVWGKCVAAFAFNLVNWCAGTVLVWMALRAQAEAVPLGLSLARLALATAAAFCAGLLLPPKTRSLIPGHSPYQTMAIAVALIAAVAWPVAAVAGHFEPRLVSRLVETSLLIGASGSLVAGACGLHRAYGLRLD